MSKHSFNMELRDQEVMIEFEMAPAEPEVGIPFNYVDEYVILTSTGEDELLWMADVTKEEEELIMDKCYSHYNTLTESDEDRH